MSVRALSLLALIASLTLVQCRSSQRQQDTSRPDEPDSAAVPPRTGDDAASVGGGGDSARIVRLEREARALAITSGCTAADQCRAAPVGERACGGPRDYIVYCARTTDSAALYRKLADLRQAEIELNRKSGAMSTCEFRMPPHVALVGGSCRSQ